VRNLRLSGVLLLVIAAGCSKAPRTAEAPASGASAGDAPVVQLLKDPATVPPFTVTDVDGRSVSLASLKGKVVLVNFWATWCPPCRAEIPDLVKLQERYRDKLVILGISEDEIPPEQVKAFAANLKVNYIVAMTTPELKKIFRGVSALPTTFVIDREGKLVRKHVGLLSAPETELEAQVLAGVRTDARIERIEDEERVRLKNAAQATEIPGVDLTKMTPGRRTEAIKAMNAEDCTCGCALTLAECRINDPSCGVSLPLARKLAEKIAGSSGS
jgi:cytochrome c biogenesis protein CcmG, thiol:disulfide interchange protein DsbE